MRQVINDEIPTSIWTKRAVRRFIKDLKRIDVDESFPYIFEAKYANHFIEFCENNLQHYEDQFAGKPFLLENWQKFLVGQIFGWIRRKKRNGLEVRRFRTANIFIGKKNGKSILASAIALYFLIYEGQGCEVYNFAMSRKHATKLSWNTARSMIQNNSELQEIFKINSSVSNTKIECPAKQSVYEPYNNDSDSADGINPKLAIFDEVKDLKDFELFETVTSGFATRISPLVLNITSCGYNTNTVGYYLFRDSKEILEGETSDDSTLAILYTIDEGDEERFDEIEVWKKANPNYDVSVLPSYVEERITKAKNKITVKNGVLVKNLNVFGKSVDGWVNIKKWDQCKDDLIHIEDVADLPAIVTVDLSSKLDLTNIKITFFDGNELSDVTVYPFDKFYLPKKRFEKGDEKYSDNYRSQLLEWKEKGFLDVAGNTTVDYNILKDDLLDLFEMYDVRYLAYDPYNTNKFIQDLVKDGVDEDILIEYTQSSYKNWNNPMKQLERLIIEQNIVHNGNLVQRWCMENVTTKENYQEMIKPVKITSDRKIDGAVTMIMAIGTFLDVDLEKKEEKKLSPIAQRIINNQKN